MGQHIHQQLNHLFSQNPQQNPQIQQQINDLQGRLQNLQQQMAQGPPGGWGPHGPPPGHPGYRPPMPGAIPPGLVPQQPTPLNELKGVDEPDSSTAVKSSDNQNS